MHTAFGCVKCSKDEKTENRLKESIFQWKTWMVFVVFIFFSMSARLILAHSASSIKYSHFTVRAWCVRCFFRFSFHFIFTFFSCIFLFFYFVCCVLFLLLSCVRFSLVSYGKLLLNLFYTFICINFIINRFSFNLTIKWMEKWNKTQEWWCININNFCVRVLLCIWFEYNKFQKENTNNNNKNFDFNFCINEGFFALPLCEDFAL